MCFIHFDLPFDAPKREKSVSLDSFVTFSDF